MRGLLAREVRETLVRGPHHGWKNPVWTRKGKLARMPNKRTELVFTRQASQKIRACFPSKHKITYLNSFPVYNDATERLLLFFCVRRESNNLAIISAVCCNILSSDSDARHSLSVYIRRFKSHSPVQDLGWVFSWKRTSFSSAAALGALEPDSCVWLQSETRIKGWSQ